MPGKTAGECGLEVEQGILFHSLQRPQIYITVYIKTSRNLAPEDCVLLRSIVGVDCIGATFKKDNGDWGIIYFLSMTYSYSEIEHFAT